MAHRHEHCSARVVLQRRSAVGLCLRDAPFSPFPQVSHHIHCNDEALDEDVFSAFPALRFDSRLPMKPWHRWQHIYMVRAPPGSLHAESPSGAWP